MSGVWFQIALLWTWLACEFHRPVLCFIAVLNAVTWLAMVMSDFRANRAKESSREL